MKLNKAIAIRISKLCVDNNLSINQLANLSCLTQSTLQHIMDGSSNNPKTNTILKICFGLNIKLKDFFEDELFDNIASED